MKTVEMEKQFKSVTRQHWSLRGRRRLKREQIRKLRQLRPTASFPVRLGVLRTCDGGLRVRCRLSPSGSPPACGRWACGLQALIKC